MAFARVAHVISVDKQGGYRLFSQRFFVEARDPDASMLFSIPGGRKDTVEVEEAIMFVDEMLSAGFESAAIRCLYGGYTVAETVAVADHDRVAGGYVKTVSTLDELREEIAVLLEDWEDYKANHPRHPPSHLVARAGKED